MPNDATAKRKRCTTSTRPSRHTSRSQNQQYIIIKRRCELDQITKKCVDLGTPSDTIWPGYSALPMGKNIVFNDYPPGGLRKKICSNLLSEEGLSLLQDLLIYDLTRRTTAAAGLEHPYFKEQPVAMEPAMFLTLPAR
ncbi:unnamed protein product [Spodoptera littoralis]|uniref:Uncharacterized protein n=1 Tax=Spodoptera littoralis TaxID=7109 RepID=A0A9P0I5J6_SPOLI|nr:unnamed protein product [Spodoptera littoralis]CAH1640579.1 unnamed protein product [Spodoptera littoralis]